MYIAMNTVYQQIARMALGIKLN